MEWNGMEWNGMEWNGYGSSGGMASLPSAPGPPHAADLRPTCGRPAAVLLNQIGEQLRPLKPNRGAAPPGPPQAADLLNQIVEQLWEGPPPGTPPRDPPKGPRRDPKGP